MNVKKNIGKNSLKNLVFLGLSLVLLGVIIVSGLFFYYSTQIPDPSVIASRRVSESTKIYDNTGSTILYDVHGEEQRTIITWEQMPDSIKHAVLAAEDNDFYTHSGIDLKGIARAFYTDITTLQASAGGSTITQQLVKKALLVDDKTLSRKIKEAILSIELEQKFSKDEILWMYLNQIPFGSNIYGIEAAAQGFFGKHAKDLTIGESAMIASVIKAPTHYSPYGNYTEDLENRRQYVLTKMKDLSFITEEEYTKAHEEKPKVVARRDSIIAPHFVIMVKEYLESKYGADIVENGGLQVTTTLDANLQKIAQDTVSKYGAANETKYKAKNAAMVSIDPKTGHILTMVGSRDYFDTKNEGNFNVATAYRQPGSSFKPFAYATAFTKGYTDSTIFFDLKTEFNPSCDSNGSQIKDKYGQACYHPQNYSGTFSGPVSAREALSRSLNIPSVEMLYLAGIDDTIANAKKMGIQFQGDNSQFGLSLVLGGAEVRLVDMVSAYGTFANDGIRVAPLFIEKVTTADGTVLEEEQHQEDRVFDSQITRLISDILTDNNARGPAFGYNSSLYFPDRPVAAKTGTTQENRDGWVVGYTPSLVTGVWTGNNDNTSMTSAGAGLSAAGPMWHEFMAQALARTPVEYFPKPDPMSTQKAILNGNFLTENGVHSILYYVDKNDPLGNQPSNPARDPQYNNWELPVEKWSLEHGYNNSFPETSISPSPTQ